MSADSFPVQFSPERLERLRGRIETVREAVREQFLARQDVRAVARELSDRTDEFLVQTLEQSLAALPHDAAGELKDSFALVAVGGSGRRDPCLHSDVDLLFLTGPKCPDAAKPWIAQIVRDLWDAGLELGHSVRTPRDCIATALEDVQFATSLVETRLLWGAANLWKDLQQRFSRRVVRARWKAFCEACIAGREEEREKHGGAVLSLVPDVKKSKGGLRDWHLLRWLVFAEFGDPDPACLVERGLLTDDDLETLRYAVDYLAAIRMYLHIEAGKAQDVLTREEQLRLSEVYGFQSTIGQRPVERFMQAYFRCSAHIARIIRRLTAKFQIPSLTDRIVGAVASHRADDRFFVRWDGIDVLPRHREEFLRDPESILQLFTLAALYGIPPKAEMVEEIRRNLPFVEFEMNGEIVQRFRRILQTSAVLEPILRSMDEAGLLEQIIPDFAHAHCLLQFNQYHAYTVDEHTFRAVRILTSFARDDGPLGKAYNSIPHPEIVHLAIILHDLGKGFQEDHCEVGKRIAERIGPRLGFSETHTAQLARLVHNHLVMPNTAFWRDIADRKVLLDFSRVVENVDVLNMLYVLTAADVAAVGPGVWTDWKAGLLTDLYLRTYRVLTGEGDPLHEQEIRHDRKTLVLRNLLRDSSIDPIAEEEWLTHEFETLPLHYLVETPADQIASDLDCISRLEPHGILIDGTYHPETGMVEYRILIAPEYASGCLHRIAGALSALRLEIQTAHICTTTKGVVVDRFIVRDPDFQGEIPDERFDDVYRLLRKVITREQPVGDLFAKRPRFAKARTPKPYAEQPDRINVENDSSQRCTVIEIFTHDRRRLLFDLTQAIFDAGLSIELTKIGTHLEQVVDVFYVTAEGGAKMQSDEAVASLRARLLEIVESDDDE